jgi:hypothetical protein
MPHQVLWSIGGTLNPLTGLNPGNYIATLTDGNLCSVTDSVLVGNSVSINEYKPHEFLIYPNPSNGNFFLNVFNNEFNSINIEVFNLSGQLIENRFLSKESNTTYEIDLDLSKGIYFLKVNNFIEKILIQ